VNQPTIADVARIARVSVATVSRALRGLDKVHPETRDRVLAAAAELDYIVSPTASGLASGRTRLVGIITPFMARWYFTNVMSSIEKTVREHQHHILLMDLEEKSPDVRLALTQSMMFKRVDGIILINVELEEPERDLILRLGLPVVAIGSRYENAPQIGIDDVACAATGAAHLIGLGHTRIGYVGKPLPTSPHQRTPLDRLEGFQSAMDTGGIPVRQDWILDSDWSVQDAHRGALRILSGVDRPSAILAGSDEMALGVLAAARTHGLRVPEDLSIVGIDDHDMAEVFDLTTVRQDVPGQGTAAANALLALMGLLDPSYAVDRTFPVELVVRGTTAPPGSTPAPRS
jgi:DNA-binding LacI/PurR family transcriptional regulator